MIVDHKISDMRVTVSIDVPPQEPMRSGIGGRHMVPTEVTVTYWRTGSHRALPKVVVSGVAEEPRPPYTRLYAHLPTPQMWPAWVQPLVDLYQPSWHHDPRKEQQ